MTRRRIIVMRHAKSSWKSNAPTDHERPLNKRGRRDAPRVAARLQELGWVPERVLSSDSTRTRETVARMQTGFHEEVEVSFVPAFYQGGIDDIREVVSSLAEGVGSVLVLGHNPGWEGAAAWLSGEPHIALKTACAALLEREAATWAEAIGERGSWSLEGVIRPKELP